MADRVECESHGIPYRATKTERIGNRGGVVWYVEYKQAPNYDWGPRGVFEEVDGRFHFGDKTFESAYDALSYRAHNV